MTPDEIVDRLQAGERDITIRVSDERGAMSLYDEIRAIIARRGLQRALHGVCVRLAPEKAIVTYGD